MAGSVEFLNETVRNRHQDSPEDLDMQRRIQQGTERGMAVLFAAMDRNRLRSEVTEEELAALAARPHRPDSPEDVAAQQAITAGAERSMKVLEQSFLRRGEHPLPR